MTSDKWSEYLDTLDYDDRMGACVELWVYENLAKDVREKDAKEYALLLMTGETLPMPVVPCL